MYFTKNDINLSISKKNNEEINTNIKTMTVVVIVSCFVGQVTFLVSCLTSL